MDKKIPYGNMEIYFTCVMSEETMIELLTSVKAYTAFMPFGEGSTTGILRVEMGLTQYDPDLLVNYPGFSGWSYYFKLFCGEEEVDQFTYDVPVFPIEETHFRVFLTDSRISIYGNDASMYTYVFQQPEYDIDQEPELSIIVHGDTLVITNIKRVELADAREALFIDYESTPDNAISSVIQERPVEIYPSINRASEYSYDSTKSEVTIRVRKHNEDQLVPQEASSDGLVYGRDVSISIDKAVARKNGLITRLYRMPDLNTGIVRAIRARQKKARQSMKPQSTSGRIYPNLEIGDVAIVNATLTGTGTLYQKRLIVETITLSIVDGSYTMNTSGRKEDE